MKPTNIKNEIIDFLSEEYCRQEAEEMIKKAKITISIEYDNGIIDTIDIKNVPIFSIRS